MPILPHACPKSEADGTKGPTSHTNLPRASSKTSAQRRALMACWTPLYALHLLGQAPKCAGPLTLPNQFQILQIHSLHLHHHLKLEHARCWSQQNQNQYYLRCFRFGWLLFLLILIESGYTVQVTCCKCGCTATKLLCAYSDMVSIRSSPPGLASSGIPKKCTWEALKKNTKYLITKEP